MKFKVGDKVRRKDIWNTPSINTIMEGTIIAIEDNQKIWLDCDEEYVNSNRDIKQMLKCGWLSESSLELLPSPYCLCNKGDWSPSCFDCIVEMYP